MEKGNKIRFIVWGFIWIIILVASSCGIYSYYNGYGKSGKLRKELMPIITEFNNLIALEQYKKAGVKVEASLINNGIKVIFNTSMSNLTFTFDYEIVEDEKVLHTKYNKVDESTGVLVVTSMFDAVSLINNHYEGDLFERFGYGDLYNTSIKQGGKIIVDSNTTHAYININTTLLDTITDEVLDTLYIKEEDITSINENLKDDGVFTFTKSETKLFVETTGNKYILYLRNGKYDNNLYKSIKSIINSLEVDNNIKEEFEHSYPMINNSTEFGHYIITIDADVSTMSFFDKKDNVVKIEIIKEKSGEISEIS